ncbi:hypothetical protein [Shewanella pneumatophori]|uniref:Secreted protein n=1 Tax=Shewanella pneumatophori TaxID=314092 RepID=A0A9X1ZMC0_9GAMM|nr:hypothetical protein [Shewanella pneumatophori]MCL1138231.1 hypothetical protein [Shewanella pneumatophori]
MLHLSLCLLISLALFSVSSASLANEQTSNPLPLGSMLDDKGRPIIHSNKSYTDLQFSVQKAKSKTPAQPLKASSKKPKTTSRKQQLASRSSVANSPSCRWLNSRMSSLERQLAVGVNVRNLHYQQELDIRQGEWECMKCGAEGPAQADHATCQYRR